MMYDTILYNHPASRGAERGGKGGNIAPGLRGAPKNYEVFETMLQIFLFDYI